MKKIKRQTADLALNRAVQLLFFLLAPDIYATAFNGVKYLAIQIGNAAVIQCTPFVAVLITVLVYTILFGRFFCGYACAFGFLGDVMYDISEAAQKRLLGKVRTIPAGLRDVLMKLKYVILAGILGLCLTGLYGKVSRFDPWEVFASFRAGKSEEDKRQRVVRHPHQGRAPAGRGETGGAVCFVVFDKRFILQT